MRVVILPPWPGLAFPWNSVRASEYSDLIISGQQKAQQIWRTEEWGRLNLSINFTTILNTEQEEEEEEEDTRPNNFGIRKSFVAVIAQRAQDLLRVIGTDNTDP